MVRVMLFRTRRGQRHPVGTGTHLAVSELDGGPIEPLDPPLPGRRIDNHRLPDIVMPSTAARLAAAAARPTRVITMYSTILGDRDTAPLFVGIDGRAAVLMRLTANQRADLNHLDEVLLDNDAQLYLSGEVLGRYGMVRAVLRLPDTEPGLFEALLSLAHGDVQDFLAAAHANDSVELHLFHATDDRMLASACSGAGIHRVIRDVLEAILPFEHPAGVAEQREPVGELAARFPKVADGLDDEAMVHLRVTRAAQPFVLFASG